MYFLISTLNKLSNEILILLNVTLNFLRKQWKYNSNAHFKPLPPNLYFFTIDQFFGVLTKQFVNVSFVCVCVCVRVCVCVCMRHHFALLDTFPLHCLLGVLHLFLLYNGSNVKTTVFYISKTTGFLSQTIVKLRATKVEDYAVCVSVIKINHSL